jgi:hypothetical protein
MDRIIKLAREKRPGADADLERILNDNRIVYIYGPSGIGKTWDVMNIINPCISIDAEILKSKQATKDFLEKARTSPRPIVIDDFESMDDLIGVRELSDKDHLVIIGNFPLKLDLPAYVYSFPKKTHKQLSDIAASYGIPVDEIDEIVKKCDGDIRYITNGTTDERDVFWTPKDFVRSLISVGGHRNPSDFIGHQIEEHGHVMDMIHDNYIDGKGDPVEILECLSIATVLDNIIYSGRWDLMPYFSAESCIRPAMLIGHTTPSNIRPGSMWTKFSNQCMREKKVRAMTTRVAHQNLDVDSLMVLRNYFEKGENLNLIHEYKLEPADFDVMNHLFIMRKLKARTISTLKKHCLKQ